MAGTKREAPGRSVHRRAQPYPELGLGHLPERLEVEVKGAETPAGRKLMKEGDSPFHFDSGKARVDQVPPRAISEVAKVFGYGAKKYGDWNWARYASEWKWSQLIGSCLRHVYAWMGREDLDPESGIHHLAHAACNLLMLLELIINKRGTDDRIPIGD